MDSETEARAISLATIARVFFKIGALAVGDTGPVLAMVERELIDRRGALSRDDVTEAMTYTKPLPGSTVVQIVSYLAYKLGGWPGSAVGTIAYLLPSALMMGLLAAGYVALTALPAVRPAVLGLTAAAVGILLATAWRFAKRNIDVRQPLTVAIAVAALAAGLLLNVNAALVTVAAGLVGAVALVERTARDTRRAVS